MDLNRCFEILEISPDATYEAAKEAYRVLAQVWHPDKHAHNEKLHAKATIKMKEINAAWSEIESYFKDGGSKEAEARKAERRAREDRERASRAEQERQRKEAASEDRHKAHQKQQREPKQPTSQGVYTSTAKKPSKAIYKILLSIIAVVVVVTIFSGKKKEVAVISPPAPAVEAPNPVYIDPPAPVTTPAVEAPVAPTPQYQAQQNSPDTSHLSSEERSALYHACFNAKTQGPASYNQCVSQQLSMMGSNRSPDTSHLSSEELSALYHACFNAKTQGPASYNQCVSEQLSIMGSNRSPDTSHLSSEERSALYHACFNAKTQGPASYNQCVSQQLSMMGR